MSFFSEIKERAVDAAQAGVAKSRQLAEIAKLKADNLAEEDTIRKAYIELGKLYYAERGAEPEGAYVSACEKITASKNRIEENNVRIMDLKTEGEITEADEPAAETPDVPDFTAAEDAVDAEPAAEETKAPDAE